MHTTDSDPLDRADMAKLAGGHDAALNNLMERHGPAVFHFLFRMLGNEEDAQDMAQETFVRVYRARGTYDSGQKFSTWLFTIAGNLARNHIRWRTRHPNVSLDAEADTDSQPLVDIIPAVSRDPQQAATAEEQAQAVRDAVQALPNDLREALVMCEWHELPVAEAATILSTTPKAVESRLYRARQVLRQQLRKWF